MITEKIEKILKKLTEQGSTLATAESCTGGMLATKLTDIKNASQVFLGGVVTYSNQLKTNLLGVNIETLIEFGAISPQCAIEMCQGVLLNLASDYAISITGIAGPTGATKDKPVGLVYIGIATPEIVKAYEFHFYGNRNEIRSQSVAKAIELLLESFEK